MGSQSQTTTTTLLKSLVHPSWNYLTSTFSHWFPTFTSPSGYCLHIPKHGHIVASLKHASVSNCTVRMHFSTYKMFYFTSGVYLCGTLIWSSIILKFFESGFHLRRHHEGFKAVYDLTHPAWPPSLCWFLNKDFPMQETRVPSDPTCHGGANPVCPNYWAGDLEPRNCSYGACESY